MTWTPKIRQFHRWTSVAFTLGVIAYIIAMSTLPAGQTAPPAWMGLFTLLPLIALLASGLFLFAQPYVARRRGS